MLTRAITAIVGVATLFACWHFFQDTGLVAICSLVTLIGCIEFSKMVEKKNGLIQTLFVCLAFSFFLAFTFFSQSFIAFVTLFVALVAYFVLMADYSVPTKMTKLTWWTTGALYCGGFTGIVTHGVLSFGGNYFTALLQSPPALG